MVKCAGTYDYTFCVEVATFDHALRMRTTLENIQNSSSSNSGEVLLCGLWLWSGCEHWLWSGCEHKGNKVRNINDVRVYRIV